MRPELGHRGAPDGAQPRAHLCLLPGEGPPSGHLPSACGMLPLLQKETRGCNQPEVLQGDGAGCGGSWG